MDQGKGISKKRTAAMMLGDDNQIDAADDVQSPPPPPENVMGPNPPPSDDMDEEELSDMSSGINLDDLEGMTTDDEGNINDPVFENKIKGLKERVEDLMAESAQLENAADGFDVRLAELAKGNERLIEEHEACVKMWQQRIAERQRLKELEQTMVRAPTGSGGTPNIQETDEVGEAKKEEHK